MDFTDGDIFPTDILNEILALLTDGIEENPKLFLDFVKNMRLVDKKLCQIFNKYFFTLYYFDINKIDTSLESVKNIQKISNVNYITEKIKLFKSLKCIRFDKLVELDKEVMENKEVCKILDQIERMENVTDMLFIVYPFKFLSLKQLHVSDNFSIDTLVSRPNISEKIEKLENISAKQILALNACMENPFCFHNLKTIQIRDEFLTNSLIETLRKTRTTSKFRCKISSNTVLVQHPITISSRIQKVYFDGVPAPIIVNSSEKIFTFDIVIIFSYSDIKDPIPDLVITEAEKNLIRDIVDENSQYPKLVKTLHFLVPFIKNDT